ncbi:MAG: hypothetical protein WBN88_16965 [Anderseniella sp.]
MNSPQTYPQKPGGSKRSGKAFWLAAIAAVAVAGGVFAWSKNTTPPKLVTDVKTSKTFFRMKAGYIYNSATGPEPVSFNIVAGCSVTITRYITGDAPVVAARAPTMYALAMSDGAALGIEIPKACGGRTTENGQVPEDFLPAIVYYESAKDLSLGMLYASEDAYDGPIAKLTFKGATIEEATAEEFQVFMETEFKKNLISLESSRFARKLSEWPQPTEEHLRDPRTFWKANLPVDCYGVARLKMPVQLKSYLKSFWNPEGQRFWMLEREQASEVLTALWNLKGGTEELYGTTFDGHPIRTYLQPIEHWGTGIVTRKGGGSFAAVNPEFPDYVRALPPEYFPITKNEGLPWVSKVEPNPEYFKRNVLVGNEDKKGFLYCYHKAPWKILKTFVKSEDRIEYIRGGFPSKLYIDGKLADPKNHVINRIDDNIIFFDRDEYIYRMVRRLL